jgi:hypothetical protein
MCALSTSLRVRRERPEPTVAWKRAQTMLVNWPEFQPFGHLNVICNLNQRVGSGRILILNAEFRVRQSRNCDEWS